MNILIVLLLLFFIILLLKLKISIHFNLINLEYFFSVKVPLLKEIKLKSDIVSTSRKLIHNKNQKISKNNMDIFLKCLEIEKLNINVSIGLVMLFPTIFAVPFLTTIIDSIKIVPFKELKNFNYKVLPVYDRLQVNIKIDTVIKISIFNIIKVLLNLIKS